MGNYYNCALVRAASQSVCLETLDKLISGNGGILRMFFCVVAGRCWQHFRMKKTVSKEIFPTSATWRPRIRGKSYFEVSRINSLSRSKAANTCTSKNTIRACLFRVLHCCEIPWTAQCCVSNTYGSEITSGAKISLFKTLRAWWSLFAMTTERKLLLCNTNDSPSFKGVRLVFKKAFGRIKSCKTLIYWMTNL